jgi:hypothetical protein
MEKLGGDLVRTLGLPPIDGREMFENLNLDPGVIESFGLDFTLGGTYIAKPKSVANSFTLMVVGDSYVGVYFTPFIVANGVTAFWTHHDWCGFDWRWIERIRPEEVWWMPNERLFLCARGRQPANMP